MSDSIVVVNYKTYQTAQGASSVKLAKLMRDVETRAKLVAAVSAFDLSEVVLAAPNLEVWCQHLDPIGF